MLNHIVIMGRLTRDPDLRRTQGDVAVASFTLACERDFKDRNGETMQQLHEWGQRKAMEEQGWTVEQFRAAFGKSYIDE